MTPGVAETEPHSADIDQRPVSGNHNLSQFCKTQKLSPIPWFLPHFAFLPYSLFNPICTLMLAERQDEGKLNQS